MAITSLAHNKPSDPGFQLQGDVETALPHQGAKV